MSANVANIYEAEAEEVVLGTLYGPTSNRDHTAKMLDVLTPEMFFDPRNRIIFEQTRSCFEEGADLTHPLTVLTRLRRLGLEEKSGGAVRLFDVLYTAGSFKVAEAHVPVLVRALQMRQWQSLVSDAPVTDAEIEAIALKAQAMVASTRPSSPPVHAGKIVDLFLRQLEEAPESLQGLPCGIPGLDSLLGGLVPGRLLVIGGRPGDGKSSLALQMATEVLDAGAKALVVSVEMFAHEIAPRLVAMRGQVPSFRLSSDSMDWAKAIAVQKDLTEKPTLLVDDQRRHTSIDHVAQRVRLAAGMLGGLDLVIIDYLQLLSAKAENRTQEVGHIARSLKLLAGELGCCVVACSQLRRLDPQQKDKKPRLDELRESGDVEASADQVILLHHFAEQALASTHECQLIVAKNRHGPRGLVDALFVGSHFSFEQK